MKTIKLLLIFLILPQILLATKEDNACDNNYSKKKIFVSISKQRVFCCEEKKLIHEFKISSGLKDGWTPKGNFKILRSAKGIFYSKTYKVWLVDFFTFTYSKKKRAIGFHSLLDEKALKKLGQPASHGCIWLSKKDIKVFGKWVKIGVPVEIF